MRLFEIESEKKRSRLEVKVDVLFQEQAAILTRSTKFSAADEIAKLLVKLSVARQASVNVATLDLLSVELAKKNFSAVRAAIERLCVTTRRDGETAFPDLATIVAAVESEERKQNTGKFIPCGRCANGVLTVNEKGQPWDDKRDCRNSERSARYCECYEA